MAAVVAQVMLVVAAIYAGIGVAFALAFVTRGVTRVDPAAAGSGWSFRLLILPGVAALWPVMAAKWWTAKPQAAEEGHA